MKQLFSLAIVALLGVAILGFQPEPTPVDTGNQVTICHFNGHDGDFVTFRTADNPLGNIACDRQEGIVITVGEKACEKGHDAVPRFGLTCAQGDQQE